MKYSELEKLLKRIGCYDTGKQQNGHPLWYSPITKELFQMSNHHSNEVKIGTLKSILKKSGFEFNYN
ncbi:MAG: type II toxin-antitoxin system HicA family toxin [Bacteroidales bacterium]|nr:type II toxin-antitoxin system HicA family toxin [Bacteroidales bacterium]MBO7529712.1 type II toxin-antitoxin system HicA family toxin [Bacteroidales bacterium]